MLNTVFSPKYNNWASEKERLLKINQFEFEHFNLLRLQNFELIYLVVFGSSNFKSLGEKNNLTFFMFGDFD